MTGAAQASSGDRVHAALMLLAALGTVGVLDRVVHHGCGADGRRRGVRRLRERVPARGWLHDALLRRPAGRPSSPRPVPARCPSASRRASAMVFLGLMDTLFNLEHGKYATMTGEMAVETAINVGCLTFGPVTIVRLWRAQGAARRLAVRLGARLSLDLVRARVDPVPDDADVDVHSGAPGTAVHAGGVPGARKTYRSEQFG